MLIRFLIMHRDIGLGCDQGLIGVKTFSVDLSCSDHLHSYIKIAIIFHSAINLFARAAPRVIVEPGRHFNIAIVISKPIA